MLAGLAAYLRGLPVPYQKDLEKPALLKKLIHTMQRPLDIDDPYVNKRYKDDFPKGPVVPFVWNGNVLSGNCLTDSTKPKFVFDVTKKDPPQDICPDILAKLNELDPNSCKVAARGLVGSSCDLPGNGGGDGITYSRGPPSPIPCTAHCGTLCTGYYCDPNPTGDPPDFGDPNDPTNKPTPTDLPATGLPTLTKDPGAPGCTSTTTVKCNGQRWTPSVRDNIHVCGSNGSTDPDQELGATWLYPDNGYHVQRRRCEAGLRTSDHVYTSAAKANNDDSGGSAATTATAKAPRLCLHRDTPPEELAKLNAGQEQIRQALGGDHRLQR